MVAVDPATRRKKSAPFKKRSRVDARRRNFAR
jgi:hypothetical protein